MYLKVEGEFYWDYKDILIKFLFIVFFLVLVFWDISYYCLRKLFIGVGFIV